MTRFFERGTAFAEMERQMMMVPNFAPRGCGSAVLCRYHPTAADVDCRNCLEHRRRGCRSLTCLYLSERLEAGAVTMDELIAETVRPWRHLPLKQRAIGLACHAKDFHFDGRLHIMRMMEMTNGEKEYINSRWLAAVSFPPPAISIIRMMWSRPSKWNPSIRQATPMACFARIGSDRPHLLLKYLL